jgi:hypothetical protein
MLEHSHSAFRDIYMGSRHPLIEGTNLKIPPF